MRRKIGVFLVSLLCLFVGAVSVNNVFADTDIPEGTGTARIVRTNHGASLDKGVVCARVDTPSDNFSVTYLSNGDRTSFRRNGEGVVDSYGDNSYLSLAGSGTESGGEKIEAKGDTCDKYEKREDGEAYVPSNDDDYYLVITDDEGNEYIHMIQGGMYEEDENGQYVPMKDSNGNTVGWDNLVVTFEGENTIVYHNNIQPELNVWGFGDDEVQDVVSTEYSSDFSNITFTITDAAGKGLCTGGEAVNFDYEGEEGPNTYSINFTNSEPTISSDTSSFKGAGHAFFSAYASPDDLGSAVFGDCSIGSGEKRLTVTDNVTGKSDTVELGELTGTATATLSMEDGNIKLSVSHAYSTGQYGDDVVDHGATGVTNQSECQKSGAAGNLGWIVCPILEWMKGAAEGVYNDYVAPSLQVKPELFTGGSGATHTAWSTFRDFANVLFIIFLLVIIFSQITGVGIDNYGIKKSLPKLILVAILINLSFVICQLCVDISNIAGNGIQGIFQSISPKESQQLTLVGKDGESATTGPIQIGTAIDASLVSVGVLVAVFTVAAVIFNPAIILTFLIAALGVIIAIFFLFALLAARQAVIVVLTVLSPLAFMCYALPNMNKLFSKWLNLWKAMLLLYPICSLLVAGGNYVSSLLLSISGESNNTGFFFAFTAMVVGIIPVFFIPTVVKSAFAAMGRLGATLSGMGALASGAAKRKAENSELNKRAQEASKRRSTRIRAGVDRKGNAKGMGRFRRAMLGGKRSIAENRAQYMKDQEAKIRADSLMDEGYDAAKIRQEKRVKEEGVESYMTLINQATRNGEDTAGLDSLYKQYMANGDANGAVAVARIAARTDEGAGRFLNQNIRGVDVGAMNEKERGVFASVAKEIATGKESGTFRSVNPFAFEFAAQYNRDPGGAAQSYDKWNEGGYAHNAINNYITSPAEMAKLSEGAWEEILGKNGKTKLNITSGDAEALREVATLMNNNKGRTGVWNQSTARYIEDVAKNGITSISS